MNKIFYITILIVVLSAVDPEQCVKDKCPNQYSACKKEVFGCAASALKCKTKCGTSDPTCFEKCCYDSGNSKLIKLFECGKENCSGETNYIESFFIDQMCDWVKCQRLYSEECDLEHLVECTLSFFTKHAQCDCLKNI